MVAPVTVLALVSTLALVAASPEVLLRQSDVGAFVPAAFRARLSLARGENTQSQVEIWRSGSDRTLVRFLDDRERGKYLLRRGADLWLLTPTARKPVRLSSSHRIYGAATIDVLFALRLADDYRIVSVEDMSSAGGPLSVFELRAHADTEQFSEVRYVVDTTTVRPVSARYRLKSGREATLVQFKEWSEDGRHARVVVVTDLLRKGKPTRIEVLEFDERAVPDGLFDLNDSSARAGIEKTPR